MDKDLMAVYKYEKGKVIKCWCSQTRYPNWIDKHDRELLNYVHAMYGKYTYTDDYYVLKHGYELDQENNTAVWREYKGIKPQAIVNFLERNKQEVER